MICSSMPPRRPTYRRLGSDAFGDSAWATAIAGNKCPPVPPPEINTRMPDPSHLRVLRRNVDQYADGGQGDRQRRATITDERQGDPGRWQRYRDGPDVDQRLERDPGGDAAGQQRAEGVGRFQRHPVSTIGKQAEEAEHRRGADQPGLFADDGEDEVGVGKGQPLVLLDALPEADSRNAARAEGDHRLDGLKSGVEWVGPGVEKRDDAMESIRLHPDEDVHAQAD